jgi:glucose/arabinose dehydrogenase/thiol-disulfide isomerase/thioredoxin
MRGRTALGTLWVVGLATCLGLASAAELPRGFRLEPVVGGLTAPAALAGTPDGRILIAERTTGNLRQVRQGMLQAAPLCSVAVDASGEGGLLGLAVHPDFTSNRWIYLYYTELASGNNKVTRFAVGSTSCSGATTILADLGSGAGLLRNGGGLSFGPDGKLYVATGDVQDSSNGQNDSTLRGKLLRVNDDGSVPADNPTPGSLVYAKGIRDGRGVAVGVAGTVYVTDGGSDVAAAHDELNAPSAGDNLGWAVETGPGGVLDPPLVAWLPTVGVRGVTAYSGAPYPDLAADGIDNDEDGFGPDHHPGKSRTDDNGQGTCVGSQNNGNACTANTQCVPLIPGETSHFCEKRDELSEYCPGGSPAAGSDDACGSLGAAGLDEPDESYPNNVFAAAGSSIRRAVLTGAGLDQLSSWSVFLDSTALPDCPTGWTGVMTGSDGLLYAVATNGGGAAGALYRITHEGPAGPREVSAPGSYFPLVVAKTSIANRFELFWEDLRDDAKQPRKIGTQPLAPEREYRVWRGTIGSWSGHTPLFGLDNIPGEQVHGALRKGLAIVPQPDAYFLVSARSANLEGTLGYGTGGERVGPAVQDLCETVGYYSGPDWGLYTCGREFVVADQYDIPRSLYEEFRGRPVLVDFGAPWCTACVVQANVQENLYQDYLDRGFEMVTVLVDDDTAGVESVGRPTAAECRNWEDRPGPIPDHTFDCWVDPFPQQVWGNLYIANMPLNVLLDSGLQVTYASGGYDEPMIRAMLDQMLGSADSCLH